MTRFYKTANSPWPTSPPTPAKPSRPGLFGVAAFIFRGKLYFGSDHMDMLDAAMASPRETP